MAGFYNTHLRRTTDPTQITKAKIEIGMVLKIKYKLDKLYLVFVLQPNTSEGKLHGLSLDAIPPQKVREISKIYNEVMSNTPKVKRLDVAKIQINEQSKAFYTSEIKTEKKLKAAYRTFTLENIKSMQVVNYDWGKYDKIPSAAERRQRVEEEARERKEMDNQ